MISRRPASVALVALMIAGLAAPALARPGFGMGMGTGWGDPYGRSWPSDQRLRSSGPAEGKVEVTRFVAEDGSAELLGKGSAVSIPAPAGSGFSESELRPYAAAVDDRLAGLGYQTATTAAAAGQVVELRVTRDVVVPEEGPKKPVSGEMEVGVSNRGSMMGLGLNIDLSKPKRALVSTRLEARIKDVGTGKTLWEGRADMVTREGSDKWGEGAVAAKLASALFDKFPGKPGETHLSQR
ncbi:hypothetical protein OKA06_01240 [Novosphingobium sp. MW5]|nr:hypothetical protein [Novosphingobium sp. MW5]